MRLIDADALMRVYQEVLCPHVSCADCSFLMDDGNCRFETMIREAPTIDVVPVVIRCRECLCYTPVDDNIGKCVFLTGKHQYVVPDGYCYKDNPSIQWFNGFISSLIHEKYPITMPYSPAARPFVVYCTEGLSDPSNGDYDTIGVWYVVKPDREKDTIERFFRESPDGWEEISKQEYFERVGENNGT